MSLDHLSFISPQYFAALIVVPLLFAVAVIVRRRRSRYGVTFTNLSVLGVVAASVRNPWWRRLPVILLVLALVCVVAALARPRVQTDSSDSGATIILLADVSGSMAATDVYPERIFAAIIAMRDLVAVLPKNEQVGLVTFADKVDVLDAPTSNFAAVDSGLNVLSAEGGSAIGDGVEAAVRLAVSSLAAIGVHRAHGGYLPAAIVLESDGAQDRGGASPLAAAEVAKAAGVRIYGVSLGTRYGTITQGSGILKESFPVPPDPGVVALLARESGGQAFNATNAASLDTIYRHLGTTVGRQHQLTEITSWFELAAAILLVAGVASARWLGAALP